MCEILSHLLQTPKQQHRRQKRGQGRKRERQAATETWRGEGDVWKERQLGNSNVREERDEKKTAVNHSVSMEKDWNSDQIPKHIPELKEGDSTACTVVLSAFYASVSMCKYDFTLCIYMCFSSICVFLNHMYHMHQSVCLNTGCITSKPVKAADIPMLFVLTSLCFCILWVSFLSLCLCVSVNKGFQGIHRFNNTLVPSWLKMSIFTIHTNRKAWYAKPVGDAGQSYFFKGYSIWHFLYIREKWGMRGNTTKQKGWEMENATVLLSCLIKITTNYVYGE